MSRFKKREAQASIFSDVEMVPWLAEWQNMPEYSIADLAPSYSVIVNFACAADLEDFGAAIGQSLKARDSRQMPSIWFPEQEIGRIVNKRYIDPGSEE